MRKVVLFVIIVFVIVGTVYTQDIRYDIDSFFTTPRQLSFGNANLLYPYDVLLFLENPATLSYTKKANFFITKLSLYTGARLGYLYNALNLASYNLSPYEWIGFDWAELTNQLLVDPYGVLLNTEPEAVLFGPLCVGYVGNGIGILLYNDFYSAADIRQGPLLPYLELKSFAEIGITFGFGTYFDILKFYTLHIGISVSYSKRYKSPLFYGGSVLEVLNYYNNLRNGIYQYDSGDSVWGDIGIIFDDGGFFKYSLVLNNFFGRTFYWNRIELKDGKETFVGLNYVSYIYPSLSLGAMFHVEKIPYIPTFIFSDFMVELNLSDLFNFSEFWFKKVKLGIELTILKIFKARGGINQGYPTFGLGIDINYINVDLSFYQYEKGVLPGHKPSQVISTSIEIKI
ncbi:MAG: hypothetical protein N2712_02925 [Brevinematales bacterium]|nr:hypothetical protein [Brevinematales bacterium]